MTKPFLPPAVRPGGASVQTQLATNLTKSMLAQNPSLKNIEARLQRDSARLSGIGKLALALDQVRTSAGSLSDKSNAVPSAGGVKDFVNALNTLQSQLRDQAAGEGANGAMMARLQQQVGGILDGGAAALAGIGITRDKGTFKIDEAKLLQAISADPGKVFQLFSAPGSGLAHRLANQATLQLATGGKVANEAAAVQGKVEALIETKSQVTEAIGRQASVLVQRYAQAGAGGSTMFGPGGGIRPMSLFDILA